MNDNLDLIISTIRDLQTNTNMVVGAASALNNNKLEIVIASNYRSALKESLKQLIETISDTLEISSEPSAVIEALEKAKNESETGIKTQLESEKVIKGIKKNAEKYEKKRIAKFNKLSSGSCSTPTPGDVVDKLSREMQICDLLKALGKTNVDEKVKNNLIDRIETVASDMESAGRNVAAIPVLENVITNIHDDNALLKQASKRVSDSYDDAIKIISDVSEIIAEDQSSSMDFDDEFDPFGSDSDSSDESTSTGRDIPLTNIES